MASKLGGHLRICACCALIAVPVYWSGSAFALVPAEQAHVPSVLSKAIPHIELPTTTFLDALFRVGQASGQCIGVIITERSAATAEVHAFDERDITLGDALAKVLRSVAGFRVREQADCAIVEPIHGKPQYLLTRISELKTPRVPIAIASYDLRKGLEAARPHPPQGGVIASIVANSNGPYVGPLEVSGRSVEAVLSKLAAAAGSTMWIAFPENKEIPEPWQWLWYTEPSDHVRYTLKLIVKYLPN